MSTQMVNRPRLEPIAEMILEAARNYDDPGRWEYRDNTHLTFYGKAYELAAALVDLHHEIRGATQ